MTPLFPARRSAEEFATAVDGDASGPTGRSREVVDLLGVVSVLRTQAPVAPREEFTRDLRDRLMAEAESLLTPANAALTLPTRTRGTRERRIAVAASVAVLVGGTATMATAAQSALPGETLYPVKRGIELADAGLSLSPGGKGRDLLDQANDRLTEVEGLLASDSFQSEPRVPGTLAEFRGAADEGSTLLFESFRETRDPDDIVAVRTFAADGIEKLGALAGSVPPEAEEEVTAAALALRDIDAEASELCATCGDNLPDLQLPGILLARAEVDRALQRASSAALDNDHPVVVPKGAVTGSRGGSADGSGSQQGAGTGDAPGSSTGGTAPAPDVLPSPDSDGLTGLLPDPGDVLPQDTTTANEPGVTGGGTADGSGGTTGDLGDTVGEVEEELEDAVETILPDTDPTLLP